MARSKVTFTKIQRERDKKRKKEEKELRKANRKNNKDLEKSLVGENVISIDMGLGLVSTISKTEDGEEFYEIQFVSQGVKSIVPVNSSGHFRTLSSKEDLENLFLNLKRIQPSTVFESSKDRLLYFKKSLASNDTIRIANSVVELSLTEGLSLVEKKMLNRMVDSLALEISTVFQKSIGDSVLLVREKLLSESPNLSAKVP